MAAALSASLVVTMSSTAFAANRPAAVPAAVDGSSVVINEAYLNGGSANAPYTNKFVELYNPTSAAVSLSGWSIQYRSATGTAASNGVVPLTGSIAAGGYYLVAGGSNGANGAALPTPDASGSGLNMQGQNGTIALVQSASAVTLPDRLGDGWQRRRPARLRQLQHLRVGCGAGRDGEQLAELAQPSQLRRHEQQLR